MNTCPSPTPPWARPTMSPSTETFTEDNDNGVVSLTMDTTYLSSKVLKNAPLDPYVVALPNGNYLRQSKQLFVPSSVVPGSAPWKVTGTFAGFGFLLMDDVGLSALLQWDGNAWQLVGGNAKQAN